MFYSHQLLARKAPLGQIWMAATMHAKINRRKLNKLNIIKICEEILNPSIPMALRLSGILMGGVVIVYERKVKLLYEDVTRLLVEINQAWKVDAVSDTTLLRKGKSQAKKEAVTMPENEDMTLRDIEHSVQVSDTMGFKHSAYFTMRLDNVDETYINNGSREEEGLFQNLHQADTENITLVERFESFQPNVDRFERFDIEGDEETHVNVTSTDYTQIPTTLIPSPSRPEDPKGDDIIPDHHPEDPVIQQSNEGMEARQENRRRQTTKRKRGQPVATTMDYDQTIVPAHTYQHWLQNTSDIVSRRARNKKRTSILSSTKIANLMKLPPVVLICDLVTKENKDIYYPEPLLDLWIKSNQPPHDSPSARISAQHPPEPSFSSPPAEHDGDFVGFHFQDFDPPEGLRSQNLMNELRANLDHGSIIPEVAPRVSLEKSVGGDNVYSAHSIPSSVSEHGPPSLSRFEKGRNGSRLTKRGLSSSGNSSGGLEPLAENEHFLEPVAENANFKLSRLSDIAPTPEHELLVETGPTQTQQKINHSSDKITDSIQAQMKAYFETPGVPQVESLDILSAGMNRKSAAQLFYQTCVLASRDALRVEQKVSYGEILISRGPRM